MIRPKQLYEWCRIPYDQLESHPARKVPFRLVKDSAAMGELIHGRGTRSDQNMVVIRAGQVYLKKA